MKSINQIIQGLILTVLFVSIGIGFTQESPTLKGESPLAMTMDDLPDLRRLSDPDLGNFVKVLAAAPQVPFTKLPRRGMAGNFFSLQHPEWPPLPGDTSSSPVWQMEDFYLLNDLGFNYDAPIKRNLPTAKVTARDILSPGDGTGDTNTYTYDGFTAPDYGTNLWIAQPHITNNFFAGIGTNTIADVQYEIQTRTNLVQSDWQSEGFILGSETANWTPLSVAQNNRTNLFIRLRSWADDGSGLPTWWQQQYFGTTGVDPEADPDGDGWSNWEEFQNGTSPVVFNQPRTPQGILTSVSNGISAVTLSWPSAGGAVVGYTITRNDRNLTNSYLAVPSVSYNIGLVNQFVDNDGPAYSEIDYMFNLESTYNVRANYANGQSVTAYTIRPYSATDRPNVYYTAGKNLATTLLVTHIPPGVSQIELERSDITNGLEFSGFPYNPTAHQEAYVNYAISNFSGAFQIPPSMLYSAIYGSYYHVRAVSPDGKNGGEVPAGASGAYFYDGRAQLDQNATFLVRAAGLTNTFSYFNADYFDPNGSWIYQPTNYAYACYYYTYDDANFTQNSAPGTIWQTDWERPFQENKAYRNFLYGSSTNLTTTGRLNTGITIDSNSQYSYSGSQQVFTYSVPTNNGPVPAVLQSTYAPPYWNFKKLGVTTNAVQFSLPNNIFNLFGLHLSSVLLAHNRNGTLFLDTLAAGSTWPKTNDSYYFYPLFDPPQFQTVNYLFGRPSQDFTLDGGNKLVADSLPGASTFSPANTPPLLIAGKAGIPINVAAFAKKIIQNGDVNKPVYVAQYFDKAYKVDASGNVTTTETGVLSPLGDFFPTEPGPAALVTMPDLATGQRGTGIVYVVSLQLDVNHDGVMDLSYFGADNNTSHKEFDFWVNDSHIEAGTNGSLDHEVNVAGNFQPNYSYGQIRSQRNLENFARLWVCGLPQFPPNQGYRVSLGLSSGTGAGINVYPAYETNGGIGYLTDTNIAAGQISASYRNGQWVNFGQKLGAVGGYYGNGFDDLALPLNASGQPSFTNFLFEGTRGSGGDLTLTIFKSNSIIAQATAPIKIDQIRNYYEEATVTNVVQTWPEMVQSNAVSGFQVRHTPDYSVYDAKELAVFVHGWRMTQFDYDNFSSLMYKRLFWQGYQGRFASLKWPTRSQDTDTNLIFGFIPSSRITYNRSEHIAFESGNGTAGYLNDLRRRFPDYKISAAAHSMGNIVMMQALKQLAASNQSPIDNYVLMQAAVPAYCYDATVTNAPLFAALEQAIPTPNTYSNYAAGLTNALRGRAINFFNPVDYALNAWVLNEGFYLSSSDGPLTLKPNTFFGYSYNSASGTSSLSTNDWQSLLMVTNVQPKVVSDSLEIMPFVARPRSLAVGAQGGVTGSIRGGALNLQTSFGFTSDEYDHSGEFNRNIQTTQVQGFYTNLLINLFPPL